MLSTSYRTIGWRALFVAAVLTGPAYSASGASHSVDIIGFAFSPSSVSAAVGDTVTWTEREGGLHTSTSDTGIWDSGTLALNQSFSFTFNAAGNYPYFCRPHTFMRGTVTVAGGGGNQPPVVSITQPANNATFPGPANLTVEANASDAGGSVTQVQFFDGSTSLGVDNNAPYSVAANFSVGSHVLTAVATDNAGAMSTSAPVNIIITAPNQPPVISITNPANNASFVGPINLTIEVSASDPDGSVTQVQFFDGTTSLGVDNNAPYSVTANFAVGNHVLTAVATDNAGAMTTSTPVNITITAPPNQPPTVSITQPTNNTSFLGPTNLTIEANASDADGSITRVEFFSGSTSLGVDSNAPYSLAANFAFGSHVLTAVATDNAGATTTSAPVNITVTAPNQAPMVSIISPTNNTSFLGPTNLVVEAAASDSDGSIAEVQFFNGSNSLGTDNAAPHSVSATLSFGTHVLTAVATDNAGLRSTSAPVNVVVRSIAIENPIAERIPKGDIAIELQTIADGLASPLGMAAPDDGSGRMFVYDQDGRVWVVTAAGTRLPTPLLDVRSRLVTLEAYDERGLLGLVTHSNFAVNPLIYTYTSESNSGTADFRADLPSGALADHQSVIAEWRIDSANTNQVALASRREIMRIDQPQANHNGGTMRFGPDGFLYIALGDGGAADDEGAGHVPGGNAQFLENVYGKFLRINVDGRSSVNGQYSVPADNPFVGTNGIDEIYAYGFRNPYTFSFDRLGGAAYVADVGQNEIEEVNILAKGGNFGWNVKEGTFFFDGNGAGAGYVTATPVRDVPAGLIEPLAQYDHDDGLAVVGGYVYRGTAVPNIGGRYIFGDWGTFTTPTGRLFYLDTNAAIKELRIGLDDRPLGLWLKGFGENASGELYVFGSRGLGPSGNTGRMLKIMAAPAPIQITNVAASATNINLAWSGGLGPFAMQQKNNLSDPQWMNAAFRAPSNATMPAAEPLSFFRVADAFSQPAVPFTAVLTGAAERPAPVDTTASGSGTFALEGSTLTFDIQYRELSSSAVAAHIHGPATAAQATNVMIDLQPYHIGSFASNGTFTGVIVLTPAQKAALLGGLTYVNVHSVNHGGGEIRGQIAPVMMQAALSAANERPNPVSSPATGSGTFALAGNRLTFDIMYRDLSGPAAAAHIHGPAATSQSTNVMVDLAPFNGGSFGASGNVSGAVELTPAQLAAVIDGLTYVNFHTAAHGGGELRGQIVPQSTAVPFTAWLSGLNERPTRITNSALGSATFALEGNRLTFNIRYTGLSGNATVAHIHGAAAASEATGVMIDLAPYHLGPLNSTNGTFSGSVILDAAQKNALINSRTYVNVHSTIYGGGEIRGQIVPVLMRASITGGNERPAAIRTLGEGSATFVLLRDELSFNISYRDLTAPASAAHIHGPANAFQTANVLVDFQPFNGGAYGVSGNVSGRVTLAPQVLADLIDGLTYVNFHTGANGGGEIRGQINR